MTLDLRTRFFKEDLQVAVLLILLISLIFSETNSADSQTIQDCLKNLISNLKLKVPNLKAFSSDEVPFLMVSKGGVTAKLREHQGLKHLLNFQNIRPRLPLACADSSNQLNFLKEFKLTLTTQL